jgi:hypothetical protein
VFAPIDALEISTNLGLDELDHVFEEQEEKVMSGILNIERWLFGLTLLAGALLLTAPDVSAQTNEPASKEQVASVSMTASKTSVRPQPAFTAYRGVAIGMTMDDVRHKLDHLKAKGTVQDVFVFSDAESAQVFYDKDGKVTAVSVDYFGKNNNPPTPREVLGEDLQAKPDGSMYELKQYPSAGYWVAYNRTAGPDPRVTITMQKMN